MLPIFVKALCCLELLGCCCRRLSQRGGADSAATLLAGCFFLRLRWQWIVLSRLGVALLSFVFWSFDSLFGLPPFAPSRLLTHATRRALCILAGTWEQIRTKILRAFGGMMDPWWPPA